MITGYDSIDLNAIPGDPDLILYYLNGSWPASAASLARFVHAQKESISVTPFANAGDWLDVETGDAFPWQAPGWCEMRRKAGHPNPGVYVQESLWKATINEFDSRGIAHPRWWIAWYDGIAVVPPGADGKQYAADHPGTVYYSGGHYDKSVFNQTLAGAGGGTHLSGAKRMLIAQDPSNSFHYLLSPGPGAAGGGWGLYKALLSQSALDVLRLYAVPEQNVNPAVLAAIPDFPAVSAGAGGGGVDLSPVLNAITSTKAAQDVMAGDVTTIRQRIEKDLAP